MCTTLRHVHVQYYKLDEILSMLTEKGRAFATKGNELFAMKWVIWKNVQDAVFLYFFIVSLTFNTPLCGMNHIVTCFSSFMKLKIVFFYHGLLSEIDYNGHFQAENRHF